MAKFAFDVAAGFGPQTAGEGSFNSDLAGVSTILRGVRDPLGGDLDEGLLLGDPESGVGESGISLEVARDRREKAVLGASFTRPMADFLKADVPTFTFAFPFCGHRGLSLATPLDTDLVPLIGFDAILQGAGLVGTAWGSGVGHSYKFDTSTALLLSALVYFSGYRLELMDCRVSSLAIAFTPGSIPIATATIAVGSINQVGAVSPAAKGFASSSLPSTLTYGDQADVSAPVIEGVANSWQDTKGFSDLTITINNSVEEIPDSNAVTTGTVQEQTAREVNISGTLYADTVDDVYELNQAFATDAGTDLDPLTFTVGDAVVDATTNCKAFTVNIPTPELVSWAPEKLGVQSANVVDLLAVNAVANEELEIIFI